MWAVSARQRQTAGTKGIGGSSSARCSSTRPSHASRRKAGGDVNLRGRGTGRDSDVTSFVAARVAGGLPELAILPAGGGKEHLAAGVVVPAGFGAVSVATVVSRLYYRTVGVRTANDSSRRLFTA